MSHLLVENNLDYTIGTGNAALMLTLAKTIAMLNQEQADIRKTRSTVQSLPGAPKSPSMLRLETLDLVHERVAIQMLERVRTPCHLVDPPPRPPALGRTLPPSWRATHLTRRGGGSKNGMMP